MSFMVFLMGMMSACVIAGMSTLVRGGTWGEVALVVVATLVATQILYLLLILGLVVARTRKQREPFRTTRS